MSDTISSLLGAADRDMPKIKRKGNKFVVDGDDQEYETMEEAIKAAARLDAGPTMTAGNPDMTSALDNMDYQEAQPQPSAKAPGATSTGQEKAPEKPEWVRQSEKVSGNEYEWDAFAKQWRPKKGQVFGQRRTPSP
jgi:predicted phage gp36 major capsid-like protein